MKYCIPYTQTSKFKYFDELAEIEITYRRKDTTLPAFLASRPENQIVNINFEKGDAEDDIIQDDLGRLTALYQQYHNFKLKLNTSESPFVQLVEDTQIPFYFDILVQSWDHFNYLTTFPITDIYIVNSFAFQMKTVAEAAHRKNIQIRVFANVAQSECPVDDLTKFYIRPEDVKYYESYVDVIEFLNINAKNTYNVYYEIYAKDQKWLGTLNELLSNFDDNINNYNIVPVFGKHRINCGKVCSYSDKCHLCHRCASLANTMQTNKLRFKLPN